MVIQFHGPYFECLKLNITVSNILVSLHIPSVQRSNLSIPSFSIPTDGCLSGILRKMRKVEITASIYNIIPNYINKLH